MSTKLTKWYPRIELQAPGIVPEVLREALRTSIIRFCRVSRLWELQLSVTPVATTHTYTLDTPDDGLSQILGVEYLEQDTREVLPKSRNWLNQYVSAWRTADAAQAEYFFQPEPAQIRVIKVPNASSVANVYTADAYMGPAEDADIVPGWLWLEHKRTIEHGALAELFSMARVPWTNQRLAPMHRQLFEEGGTEGLLMKMQGRGLDRPIIQAASFGGIQEF